jgi:hypothetical protein
LLDQVKLGIGQSYCQDLLKNLGEGFPPAGKRGGLEGIAANLFHDLAAGSGWSRSNCEKSTSVIEEIPASTYSMYEAK